MSCIPGRLWTHYVADLDLLVFPSPCLHFSSTGPHTGCMWRWGSNPQRASFTLYKLSDIRTVSPAVLHGCFRRDLHHMWPWGFLRRWPGHWRSSMKCQLLPLPLLRQLSPLHLEYAKMALKLWCAAESAAGSALWCSEFEVESPSLHLLQGPSNAGDVCGAHSYVDVNTELVVGGTGLSSILISDWKSCSETPWFTMALIVTTCRVSLLSPTPLLLLPLPHTALKCRALSEVRKEQEKS